MPIAVRQELFIIWRISWYAFFDLSIFQSEGERIMKINLIRLYALTKYEVFNNTINCLRDELKNDNTFTNARDKIFSKEKVYIGLPSTFEKMVHLHFSKAAIEEYNGKKSEPNWKDMFRELQMMFSFENTALTCKDYNESLSKQEILKQEKDSVLQKIPGEDKKFYQPNQIVSLIEIEKQHSLKAYVILALLQKSWVIIYRYFPLKKWGLPSLIFLETLMNMMIEDSDNLLIRNPNPYLHIMDDIYGLEKEWQISYLINRLKDFGVEDPEKEMEEAGVYNNIAFLKQEILQKNPTVAIMIDPTDYKGRSTVGLPTELRDQIPALIKDMSKLYKNIFNIKKVNFKYNTYMEYIDKYLPDLLNSNKSIEDILPEAKSKAFKEYLKRLFILIEDTGLNDIEELHNRFQEVFLKIEIENN